MAEPFSDHRERLEALRDQLANAIAGSSSNVLPQLAAQYRATLADLRLLPQAAEVVSKRNELAERRKSRGSTPEVVADPVKRSRKRG